MREPLVARPIETAPLRPKEIRASLATAVAICYDINMRRDTALEEQREAIEEDFREGWVPVEGHAPRTLSDAAYAEARTILDQGGWTGLDKATIEAVRGGAQPGDELPPLERSPFIRGVLDNAEVIITGEGAHRRVAVLFSHKDFPDIRFGHRFPPPEERGSAYGSIWLKEEIETKALHRLMLKRRPQPGNGVIWTGWGANT
jgi:hypothetical protein